MRYVRFANELRELINRCQRRRIDRKPRSEYQHGREWHLATKKIMESKQYSIHVAFEEVRRHRGVTAAHIYGGLMATLQSVLELDKHPYVSIPVGTIKKHATGKGNSGKELMISTAEARWQEEGWQLKDDNEADALWVASAYLAGLF